MCEEVFKHLNKSLGTSLTLVILIYGQSFELNIIHFGKDEVDVVERQWKIRGIKPFDTVVLNTQEAIHTA